MLVDAYRLIKVLEESRRRVAEDVSSSVYDQGTYATLVGRNQGLAEAIAEIKKALKDKDEDDDEK